jgi:hypothetical protein
MPRRLLASALAMLLGSALRGEAAPKRYLFLDPALLESMDHAELAVHPPQRRETVIRPDRPWEDLMISFFLTVREEAGVLRMWYICRDKANHPNVAYAESRDGVVWTKPDLGVAEYDGSKANNLVGLRNLEGVVFADPKMPASQRYQYVSSSKPSKGPADAAPGIYRFYSPDGLHWSRDEAPLLRCGSDTQNVTFWDENIGSYVLYFRGWTNRYRRVLRIALPDLKTPLAIVPKLGEGKYFDDEVPSVLQCDAQDPARTDIYNMAAQPYAVDPSWYVAFPAFLRRSAATAAPGYHGSHRGPVEVQFVGSRDGIHWNRYDRAPYAKPGVASPDKKNMNFMGTGLVVRGDEIWQYGTEFESEHGDTAARQKKTDGVIVRYVQRLDGFVALTTGDEEGRVRTAPVKVTGNKLLLNLDTGALGELRAGFVDPAGRPVPGFAVDACDPIEINSLGAAMTWSGRGDLSALRGKDLRLELRSRRTRLFSFRFE